VAELPYSDRLQVLSRHAALSRKPDPTFYPSPRMAAAAPPETVAYVVTLNRRATATGRPTRSG
jgi:hypothetical protein